MSDKTICHKCGKLTCWIKMDSVIVCAECACKENQLLKDKVERLESDNFWQEKFGILYSAINDKQATIDKLTANLERLEEENEVWISENKKLNRSVELKQATIDKLVDALEANDPCSNCNVKDDSCKLDPCFQSFQRTEALQLVRDNKEGV